MLRLVGPGLLVGMAACLTGCSTFTHYPTETLEAREAFARGSFDEAYSLLEEGLESDLDRVCYVLERAMISHTGGEFERSNADFETALDLFEEYERQGTLSKAGEQAASLLMNEKAIP